MTEPRSDALVLFGATGDLTKRKLVPALARMYRARLIHPLSRIIGVANNMEEAGRLADLTASNLDLKVEGAQAILEALDPAERLRRVHELMTKELEVLTMQQEISSQAKGEMDRTQREFFLREQLKAIQSELGEGSGDVGPSLYTRRRVSLDEIFPHPEDANDVEAVLGTLADARLITTERETVQVAHEALIRSWGRLRDWIDQRRESLVLLDEFRDDAQRWQDHDRDH